MPLGACYYLEIFVGCYINGHYFKGKSNINIVMIDVVRQVVRVGRSYLPV